MSATKKITVLLPDDLLKKACRATRRGVTETLREGLRLVASQNACEGILRWKGRYNPSIKLSELRKDRS